MQDDVARQVAEDLAQAGLLDAQMEDDSMRYVAGHLFLAWHHLKLAGQFPPGSAWPQHERRLEALVSRDEVRGALAPAARRLVDTYGPHVPRCRRDGLRLVTHDEIERGLCNDCAMDFMADAEAEAMTDAEVRDEL